MIFPDRADDSLNAAELPPTGRTQLDYRTRPLSTGQELRITALVLLVAPALGLWLAGVGDWVFSFHRGMAALLLTVVGGLTVWVGWRRLIGAPRAYARALLIALAAAWMAASGLGLARRLGEWTPPLALFAMWCVVVLVTRQAAAWTLAGPTVGYETRRQWRHNLPGFAPTGFSLDCPELVTLYAGPLLMVAAWRLADWLTATWLGSPLWFPAALPVGCVVVWAAWSVLASVVMPPADPIAAAWAAARGLVVFLTYDPHATAAAGVFKFPTIALRPILVRWAILAAVVCSLAACYWTALVGDEVSSTAWLAAAVGFPIASSVTLVATLWLTGAPVLARFSHELDRNQDDAGVVWSTYVERLINSDDALERDHFLAGFALEGDYPVLVHKDLLDSHVHILGDTGAAKTSLGMAPMATQLIARADGTVVLVDLKGDAAFRETCRIEAQRAGMPFRWLSNKTGTPTFAFNPLLQTHNAFLTPPQIVQELLQGLALDYGLLYGAAYFTAMNEIVLGTVFRQSGARSFRELDRLLRDAEFYSQFGPEEDWKQARHLGALVSRLAECELLNVTPDMYPGQPEVHAEALDAIDLFERPQVVYLSLDSSIEATGAPAIARLFLWSLFAASRHRREGDHRVYVFLDEFQQLVSDGMKLIFEQFRGLGGTLIAAHQTAGQLRRQGTDLGQTVDSCTAMKQVFRASDLDSLERLQKLSGTRTTKTAMWMQRKEWGLGGLFERYDPVHAVEDLVRVREEVQPRYDMQRLQEISSHPQDCFVRFTLGSGYTQFAGRTIAMRSPYEVSFEEYKRRMRSEWPSAPGAFTVSQVGSGPSSVFSLPPAGSAHPTETAPPSPPVAADFLREFDRRAGETLES